MKVKSFLLALVMVLSVLSFPMAASAADTVDITVISFNDFHGAVTTTGDSDRNMGSSKFTQAIQDEVAKNPNTIVLSAGDSYNGTAISNLLYGEPVSAMLKEIGIKASAIGNHEFDWGKDKLDVWSKAMGAPFLAANITVKETGETAEFAKPYIITEVAGIKVGILGLTTPETQYKTKPENVADYNFDNPVETAAKYVPIMKEAGADIVVILSHIGTFMKDGVVELEAGSEGLAEIAGVDAIVTGHTHQTVAGKVNGVPVVQAYYNGRSIGVITLTVDTATKKVVSSEVAVDALSARKKDVSENAKMSETVAKYVEEVGPILNEVIGETKLDMSHDKGGLSVLGQWTAEVMQKAAGADVAVTNGGGLRTSINAGEITMGKLYEVMPFDNVLSSVDMLGSQLKEVFEHGIENTEIGWLQFSGVKVEYYPGAEKGKKVKSMTLLNGEPVEDDAVYRVVTNDFMVTGGDGYTTFLQADYLGDTVAIREAMVEAIKEAGVMEYVPVQLLTEAKAEAPVLTPAPVPAPAAEAAPNTSDASSDKYVVQQDDVLWKIAKKFNTTWQALAEFNKLKNPNLIYVDQIILIP